MFEFLFKRTCTQSLVPTVLRGYSISAEAETTGLGRKSGTEKYGIRNIQKSMFKFCHRKNSGFGLWLLSFMYF